MLLGETKQGPMRPPYPGSRAISPAPFLRWKKHIVHTSFRMKLQVTEREPTGAMKMKKKAGQESLLSCRFFLIFPGCKSIRRLVFHTAQPVARRQCRSQFAKSQCSFCKGVSAWPAVRAANSQSYNRPFANGFLRGSSAGSQLAKTQSSSVKACVRVALQHRNIACKIHIAISGTGSRGNAPCGVQG